MKITNYYITNQARLDYIKVCNKSFCKISLQREDKYERHQELNRHIKRCANLGKVVDRKGEISLIHYHNLNLIVNNFSVVNISRVEKNYHVLEEDKKLYDEMEREMFAEIEYQKAVGLRGNKER